MRAGGHAVPAHERLGDVLPAPPTEFVESTSGLLRISCGGRIYFLLLAQVGRHLESQCYILYNI